MIDPYIELGPPSRFNFVESFADQLICHPQRSHTAISYRALCYYFQLSIQRRIVYVHPVISSTDCWWIRQSLRCYWGGIFWSYTGIKIRLIQVTKVQIKFTLPIALSSQYEPITVGTAGVVCRASNGCTKRLANYSPLRRRQKENSLKESWDQRRFRRETLRPCICHRQSYRSRFIQQRVSRRARKLRIELAT